MFIEALLTKAKTRKESNCPCTEEWLKKMYTYRDTHVHTHVHTHTYTHVHKMEYYSATKKNQIMQFAATRMDLKIYTK